MFSPGDYIKNQSFTPSLEEKLTDWISYKKESRKAYKETGLRNLCTQVKNQVAEYGDQAVIDLITECIGNNWQGIIWDKLKRGDYNGRSGTSSKPKESDNSKYNGLVL